MQRKTEIVTLRMMPKVKKQLWRRAQDVNMTLTDYLCICGLGKKIRTDGLDDVLSELKAQGRNLNQLTTLANMGKLKILRGDDLVNGYVKLCEQVSRLSQDDGSVGESGSIQTQKTLLTQYRKEHHIKVGDCYCDNGWSRTNFDRPSFKRMIDDIELGKINMVIVNDLSRFGREYAQMGMYIEHYFEEKGVRFISVAENIDSKNGIDNLVLPFTNVINSFYARQASSKTKGFFDKRREDVPENEWIVTENAHEPLVSQELWDTVHQMMKAKRRENGKGEVQYFTGLVKCADCGSSLNVSYDKKRGRYTGFAGFIRITARSGVLPRHWLEDAEPAGAGGHPPQRPSGKPYAVSDSQISKIHSHGP